VHIITIYNYVEKPYKPKHVSTLSHSLVLDMTHQVPEYLSYNNMVVASTLTPPAEQHAGGVSTQRVFYSEKHLCNGDVFFANSCQLHNHFSDEITPIDINIYVLLFVSLRSCHCVRVIGFIFQISRGIMKKWFEKKCDDTNEMTRITTHIP